MKLYYFFSLLFLLVHCQRTDDAITLYGTIHSTDKILYSTHIERPAKSRRGYISYDFNFESYGSKNIKIHAVKITAQDQATVTLTNGGPGYKSVDLHFESKRGGGISKTIVVYGE
jgi:hypothetical protein